MGRNNDDAAFICKGLEVLLQEWEAMETRVHESQLLLDQVKENPFQSGSKWVRFGAQAILQGESQSHCLDLRHIL